MPARELIGKVLAFGIAAAAFFVCGALVLVGQHASNDYVNGFLGITLIALGLLTGGFGVVSVAAMLYERRQEQQESQLHITPRDGEPGPPPAWGMGDVGRPSVTVVGDTAVGKGGSKVMSVAVSNLDAPIFVVGLLAWTLIALILFAPK